MVVVVAPFSEVICKLHPRCIGIGVLEVDDDQLSVFVFRVKEWALSRRLES